jgi:hypothetical protein
MGIAEADAGDTQKTPHVVKITSPSELNRHVGERVSVEGIWSDRGKSGPYVRVSRKKATASVYIEGIAAEQNRLYGRWDEHRVRITGVLRYFPSPAQRVPATEQSPPSHFYIRPADLKVEDLGRTK